MKPISILIMAPIAVCTIVLMTFAAPPRDDKAAPVFDVKIPPGYLEAEGIAVHLKAECSRLDPRAWHQLLSGWLIGAAIGMLYGFRYTDMCAFRAIRRDLLIALGMREMSYGWNLEMQMKAARKGLRILEVPVPYSCRAGGRSKVAGSLYGSLRAGSRILLTYGRMAFEPG